MSTVFVHDLMPVTERVITPEGYLVAPGILARTGVQKYRSKELRGEDGQPVYSDKRPDDIISIYRSADEVLSEDSVSSFEQKPITLGHPDPTAYPRGVTSQSWKQLSIGHVSDCVAKDGFIKGVIHVRDASAVAAVVGGKSALSNGYSFELDKTSGMSPDGQAYDGIQKKVRGNHVAIVDVARGGSNCRIADHSTEEKNMKTIAVDGVSYQVEDQAASLIEKLTRDREEARTALATRTTDHAAAITKLTTGHDAEVAKLKAQIVTPEQIKLLVIDHSQVLAEATKRCPELKTDGLDAQSIRRGVITDLSAKHANIKSVVDAALAGVALDKADEAQVKAAYNVALASVGTQDSGSVAAAFAAPGGDKTVSFKGGDAEIPEFTPEKNAASMRSAWKGPQK